MTEESVSNGFRVIGDSFPGDDRAAAELPSGAVITQAIEAVRELADILSRSSASKLVVCVGAIRWEVERHAAPAPAHAAPAQAAVASQSDEAVPVAKPGAAGQVVTAPLVGVFYRAPAPGQPPFAELGSHVEAGQQVGIVEAMKTMNEVLAPCSGTVTEIHVTDSEIVEHGQPLFTIAPGAGAAT